MSKILLVMKDSSRTVSINEAYIVRYSDGSPDITVSPENLDLMMETLKGQGYTALEQPTDGR